MGLSAGKPWRTVTHIKDRKGVRGGEHWVLTLECGHLKAVTKPKFSARTIFKPLNYFLAPKRVRCIVCA